MRPHILLFDDFFAGPEAHLSRLLPEDFRNVVAPEDGVTYPGINPNVSTLTASELLVRLEEILRARIHVRQLFWRLTSRAQPEAPNQIHSDYGMASFAAHIYFSRFNLIEWGTSFWIHCDTWADRATDETNFKLLHSQSNDKSKWVQYALMRAEFNRCLIHDATLWHCAEPIGGFGSGLSDGRLVLTCFFDII